MSRIKLARLLSFACVVAGLGLAARATAGGPHAPVVGGRPAPDGKWPDAAAVTDGGFAFCTGTLVAPQVVVTAGHCVDGSDAVSVKLDAVDSQGPGEEISVAGASAYPEWETTFDIAVLVLEQPSTVPPRPVATDCVVEESLVNGAPVTLVGFGATTEEGEDLNTTLMEGEAQILDADCTGGDGCAAAVSPGGEFVAGAQGVDSCFGDSGGPVYLPTPNGTVLAGVVSRGVDSSPTPCGGGGIYVRPDGVLDWIEETAGQPIARASCAPPPPPDPPDDDDGRDSGETRPAGTAPVTGGCSASDGGASASALVLLALALGFLLRRRI